MFNIILFGPPGAGKGTQSDKLIEKYNLTHISTGDLFRIHLNEGSELGQQAQSYMDEGNLVPDEIVIGMVDAKINETTDSNGFIFDGFPRTVAQAQALDQLLEEKNSPISGMVCLEVPDGELKNRIKERSKTSGRVDDQDEDKIDNRIAVYKQETLPVANHYQQQGKLNYVDGVGSIEDIFTRVTHIVDQY